MRCSLPYTPEFLAGTRTDGFRAVLSAGSFALAGADPARVALSLSVVQTGEWIATAAAWLVADDPATGPVLCVVTIYAPTAVVTPDRVGDAITRPLFLVATGDLPVSGTILRTTTPRGR